MFSLSFTTAGDNVIDNPKSQLFFLSISIDFCTVSYTLTLPFLKTLLASFISFGPSKEIAVTILYLFIYELCS